MEVGAGKGLGKGLRGRVWVHGHTGRAYRAARALHHAPHHAPHIPRLVPHRSLQLSLRTRHPRHPYPSTHTLQPPSRLPDLRHPCPPGTSVRTGKAPDGPRAPPSPPLAPTRRLARRGGATTACRRRAMRSRRARGVAGVVGGRGRGRRGETGEGAAHEGRLAAAHGGGRARERAPGVAMVC